MVKTPRTRHSKTVKEPVTIDLQPGEVSRVKAEAEKADAAREKKPADKASPPPASAPAEGARAKSDAAFAGKPEEPAKAAAAPASDTAAKPADTPGAGVSAKGTASAPDAASREQPKPASGPSAQGAGPAFGRKEQAPPPPPAPVRRGGALLAGMAGGVIALLLAGGLQFAGLLPGAGTAPPDRGPAIAALEAEIAELRDQIAALDAAGGEGAALGGRIGETEERLAALASELETLRGDVARLGEVAQGEAPAVDLGPLDARIASLEAAVAGLNEGEAPPQAALDAVDAEIASLREEVAAIDALREDIATLRGQLSDAREGGEAAATRIEALEQALGVLAERVDEGAGAPGTAQIIAASALKAAIDRGTPFTTELDTYASLVPNAPEIVGLRAFAAEGVPTRAQIEAGSDAAANAMIAAEQPVDPQAGLLDRLWGSAMGLVQVRPIGMAEGEGVPETVARLDAAVRAGDYERAVAEFDALPGAARAAGEAFMAGVRARHEADRLADQALAAALNS